MKTSSNRNLSRYTGHLCAEFTGHRWIPRKRPVTRSFDVFFDLHLNKRLSKQWRGWWFETPSHPLWFHCNVTTCLMAHPLLLSHLRRCAKYLVSLSQSLYWWEPIMFPLTTPAWRYIFVIKYRGYEKCCDINSVSKLILSGHAEYRYALKIVNDLIPFPVNYWWSLALNILQMLLLISLYWDVWKAQYQR